MILLNNMWVKMINNNLEKFILKSILIKINLLSLFFVIISFSVNANDIIDTHSFNDVASLTKKVIPSVVPIRTTKTIENSLSSDGNKYLYYKESSIENSIGSGFIISDDGYILTNTHVIEDGDRIFITYNNKEYEVELIGFDDITDIAVVKIKNYVENLPYLELKNNIKFNVGENVIVVGNPYGLGVSVSYGIISALNRSIKNTEYSNLIQTDATINKGNSGGPMFNLNGDVIGITSMIFSETGSNSGIGFAIPIKNVVDIVERLKIYGYVQRGWLGIKAVNVDANMAIILGIGNRTGVLITDIFKNSPAEKADLRYNDIIVSFDNKQVRTHTELTKMIRDSMIDGNIPISILRNGKIINKKIKIAELPLSVDDNIANIEVNSIDIFDMYLTEINKQIIDKFELYSSSQGLLVIDIKQNGKADKCKIEIGDIVLTANQQQLKNKNDLLNVVKQSKIQGKKKVLLLIKKTKERKNILVSVNLY